MSPRGYLAIVGGHKIAAPWDDDLNSIIPSYSTNRDFAPYDLIGELERRKLYSVRKRVRTAPRQHHMGVDRYVELLHARNGFSRQRMRPQPAAEFDGAVRDLVVALCRWRYARPGNDHQHHLGTPIIRHYGVTNLLRRLVLVRHSLPEIEPDKPASAWRLGEAGRRRAEMLASRLGEFNPSVIWSSVEPKAVETAEIVAEAFGVPVEVADGLEEHHRRSVPFFATREEFEGRVEKLFQRPDQLVLGEETADQARARMVAAIAGVIDAGQTDSIVVTHGTVMTLYAASAAGVQPMSFWRRLGLPSYVVLSLPSMNMLACVESVVAEDAPDD